VISVLVVLVVAISGFLIWAETPSGPMAEANAALQSNDKVQVLIDRWFIFKPKALQKSIGFIIYPGGHVDPRSYAPAAHAIAGEGYTTIIVPMPLNLAVFAADSALDVIKAMPEIKTYGQLVDIL